MIHSKNTLKQKISLALASRRIKHQSLGAQLLTEYGDLVFGAKTVTIRYPGQTGPGAAFKYSDNPTIGHILSVLIQPKALHTLQNSTIKPQVTPLWLLRCAALLLIIGGIYAATHSDLGKDTLKRAPGLEHSIRDKKTTIHSNSGINHPSDLKKEIVFTLDTKSIERQISYFETLDKPDQRVNYTFEPGTWLKDNLEHVSRLTRHHIIYAANIDFKINSLIIESGRGSELTKRVFRAISSEFDGRLILVQCKNTSIITDQFEISSLCGERAL